MLRLIFDVPFRGSIFLVLSGGALCVLCGIGSRHLHRDVYEIRATGPVDGVLYQSAALVALGLADAGGSDAEMAAADHAAEPHPPLRHHHPLLLMKGSGLDTFGRISGADRIRHRAADAQRQAVPQTTRMKTSEGYDAHYLCDNDSYAGNRAGTVRRTVGFRIYQRGEPASAVGTDCGNRLGDDGADANSRCNHKRQYH